MATLYRSGKTLQQIGDEYNLTRERARQLIKWVGLSAKDGGARILAEANSVRRAIARDARYAKKFGCTFDQYRSANKEGEKGTWFRSPIGAFNCQRSNAKMRGIEWRLTFWEWWCIWKESGNWGQRGRGQGYCMSRHGDLGAYEPGNVSITPSITNSSECHRKRKKTLPIGVSESRPGRYVAVRMLGGKRVHLGTHGTPELAHAAYLSAAPIRPFFCA